MRAFGEILIELRENKRMTQRQLAKIIHVTPGTISNYEKGVHYPDVEKLKDLADFFDVSTDYLLGRCESTLSPGVLMESVVEGKTVGEVIQSIQRLPSDRRNALLLILEDMEFRATVSHYGERGRS